MDNRYLALSLLFMVVLVSGCIKINTGDNTQSEGTDAITVHKMNIEPREIYDESSVRVVLEFANTGARKATVDPGNDGQRVLKDYCPDLFQIAEDNGFQASGPSGTSQEQYDLQPGQEISLRWLLQERPDNEVPLYGQRCNLKVEVPFDYGVSAFRQIQIKQNKEIQGSKKLQSKSSEGPLLIAIETIGGTGEEGKSSFVAGRDQSMRILFQLVNQKREGYNKGVTDIDESSLRISAEEPISFTEGFVYDPSAGQCENRKNYRGHIVCGSREGAYVWSDLSGGGSSACDSDSNDCRCSVDGSNELRMFEGHSRVITCDVDIPDSMSRPSVVSDIEASVNYTYLKDAGSREIKVKHRGN